MRSWPRPRLLLLDEPMAGMTASEKDETGVVIREARARFDLTVVMIEHDIGMVMGLSDTVAVLDPVRWKHAILGNYALNDVNPPLHAWS